MTITSKMLRVLGAGLAALLLACCMGLVGCASQEASDTEDDPRVNTADTSGGVAATVNGVEIGENAITAYIESFRSYQAMDDDEVWAQWMIDNSLTVEDVRSETIDYYVSQELLRQAADQEGISVDSSEVDEQIQAMKDTYDSDEEWLEALESSDSSEALMRELVELSLLQADLLELVAGDVSASDDDVLAMVSLYAAEYDGTKRSSHILFDADDEETAQEVLDLINSGELDFADAAEQYSIDTSTAENGGDVGWDFQYTYVTEYQDALDELEVGEVSELVTSSYGIHIIMCTDELDAPDEVTSLDDVSEGFVEYIRSVADSNEQSEAFSEWMTEFEEESDIVINDMPEGLSYYVDLEAYEASLAEDEDSEEESDEEADSEDEDSSEASVTVIDEADSEDDSDDDADDEDSSADDSSDDTSEASDSDDTESGE